MSVPTIPKQWDRWIYTSAAKHFDSLRSGVPMFVEGFSRETSGLAEWIEFRMDGPFYKRHTKGQFRVATEINLAACVIQDNNAYRIHDLCGIIAAAFSFSIPVYRLGDVADDAANDGSQLGCLQLLRGDKEEIDKSFFGKVRPDTRMIQASVEGHYRMLLST